MSSQRFSNNDISQDYSCAFCNEHISTSEVMGTHLMSCGTKTNLCPTCNQWILRAHWSFHINNNCLDPTFFDEEIEINNNIQSIDEHKNNPNESIDDEEEKSDGSRFDPLFRQAINIHDRLSESCYQSELEHVADKVQFNIIVLGSPRVGKSELINALCDGKHRAETSPSLNSCTTQIKCYTLEDNQQRNSNTKRFKINFYDTPGIESWTNENGKTTMIKFIEEKNPVCVIYCASPGSFANLDQLHNVLEYCQDKQIFCALVCTNMWSGNQRHQVIQEFEKQLEFFGEKTEKFSNQTHTENPHKVTFFGDGALCTMVNSTEYYDQEFSDRRMAIQGIDELIHGIMEKLDQEKLLGWCYAVLYRRTYWEKITQKIGGFFQLRLEYLYNLIGPSPEATATLVLDFLQKNFNKKKYLK